MLQTVVLKLKPKVDECSRIGWKKHDSITEELKSIIKTVPSKYHYEHYIQYPKNRGVECRQSVDLSAGFARYNEMTLFWCFDKSSHFTRFPFILTRVLYVQSGNEHMLSFEACKILITLNYVKNLF